MPITERLGLLVIAVTLALCLSAGGTWAQDLSAPPHAPELTYPKLGSRLDEMATGVEEGRDSAQGAAGQATISEGESVAVTIYLSGNVDAVVAFLEANGGSPRNVGTDYIEAYVPVSLLGETSEQPGVVRIREIVPPQSQYGPISGQAAGVHRATAWNLDGNTGRGRQGRRHRPRLQGFPQPDGDGTAAHDHRPLLHRYGAVLRYPGRLRRGYGPRHRGGRVGAGHCPGRVALHHQPRPRKAT